MTSVFIALLVFLFCHSSYAVDVPAGEGWKFALKGFVEMDFIHDSTRSFREISGNAPVARPDTFDGENGRLQTSLRNTRIAFLMAPPEEENFKQNILLAVDFLGYNPNPGTTPPVQTESAFYSNPTPRLLVAHYTLERNNWRFMAGLAGALFGWQPRYFLTTAAIPPVSGMIYARVPQLTAVKTIAFENLDKIQIGLSLSRPTQRDSEVPNIDGGLRFTFGDRKSGFSTAAGDTDLEAATIALSGTYRQFVIPSESTTSPNGVTKKHGSAIAFNTMIPVVSTVSNDASNTLTWTGEYSTGSGYSDCFVGASGNIPQMPSGTAGALSTVTNLDPGIGGYDSQGSFSLARLQTWNTQLQYHLPKEYKSFMTLGYGQLHIKNPEDFTPLTNMVLYDKSETYFINFFHDITKTTRFALEYARISTHYVDGITPVNNRVQFSTWVRF